jgi:hypothetical protein
MNKYKGKIYMLGYVRLVKTCACAGYQCHLAKFNVRHYGFTDCKLLLNTRSHYSSMA